MKKPDKKMSDKEMSAMMRKKKMRKMSKEDENMEAMHRASMM